MRQRDQVHFYGGVCCGVVLALLVVFCSTLPTTRTPLGSHWSLVANARP